MNQRKYFKDINIFLGLGIFAMAIFGQSIHFDFFILDDALHITDNPKTFFSLSNIKWFWYNSKTPIPYNVWQFIELLNSKNDPQLFRLLNIATHTINSFLVFKVFKKLTPKSDIIYSVLGAFVFLIHPLQVEGVVWISSLRGLLSTFFTLISMNFYLSRKNFNYIALAFGLTGYLLALLCRPTMITLPVVYILLDLVWFKVSKKELLKKNSLYLIVGMIGVYLFSNDVLVQVNQTSISNNIILTFDSITTYVLNFIFPFNLTIAGQGASVRIADFFSSGRVYFALIILISFAFSIIRELKKKKENNKTLGILIFLVLILPVSGIVNFHFQAISTVADRYMYLPIIGLILILIGIIAKVSVYKKLFATSLIAVLTVTTFLQVTKWKDDAILVNTKNEKSFYYQMLIGGILLNNNDLQLAEERFQKARSLTNEYIDPISSLMKIYHKENNLEKAQKLASEVGERIFSDQFILGNYLSILSMNFLDDEAIRIIKKKYKSNQYNLIYTKLYFQTLNSKLQKKEKVLELIKGSNNNEELNIIIKKYQLEISNLEKDILELKAYFD